MRRVLAPLLAGLALAGCNAPDAVEIHVALRELRAPRYRLLVERETPAFQVVDCTLLAIGAREGVCPFEAPQTGFVPADGITFVAYGDGDARLRVRVEAQDAGGRVLTSTTTTLRLGDAPRVELGLPSRTEPRHRCVLPLASLTVADGLRDDTALVTADVDGDGRAELIAFYPGGWVVAAYVALPGGGCRLEELSRTASECGMRPSGVAVGELSARRGRELAALCNGRAGTARATVEAWNLGDPRAPFAAGRFELPVVGGLVTRPSLGDLDGDGLDEVWMVLSSTTSREASLGAWSPSRNAWVARPLRNILTGTNPGASPTHAPVIARSASQDVIYVLGYRGGGARLTGSPSAIVVPNALGPSNLAPILLQATLPTDRRLLWLRDTGMATTVNVLRSDLSPEAMLTIMPGPRLAGVNLAAPAIGGLFDPFSPDIVYARDGQVLVAPLGAAPRTFTVGEAVSGPMTVLLSSLDGEGGPDLLAFTPQGGRLFGVTRDGDPIPGWPLDAGVAAVPTRVVVGDLDADGATEVVVSNFLELEVIGLGPMTYDSTQDPWPMPFGDARNTSTFGGNAR